jgi:hypothetical protein
VGFAGFELRPVYERLVKSATKLFADETRCPVLDPGRGKTKTGYLWAIARRGRARTCKRPPVGRYHPTADHHGVSMRSAISPASRAPFRLTATSPTSS